MAVGRVRSGRSFNFRRPPILPVGPSRSPNRIWRFHESIRSVLALFVTGGLSMGAAGLQQPAKLPAVRDIQRLKDNLYMISGGDTNERSTWTGGNSLVFVTDSGVVLVDTMLPGAGTSLLAQDQVGDRQAGDHGHQHAYALRPLRQQQRASGRRSSSSRTRARGRTWPRRRASR